MRRALITVAVLGALGYAGLQLADRITLAHYGDPATPDGYLERYVDHRLRLVVDREQLERLQSGRVVLRGRLRNGGERPLRDVVVTARYATEPTAPRTETVAHLGLFAPGEERNLNEPLGVVTLPPGVSSDRVELFSELVVERVVFAATPGSTASRP